MKKIISNILVLTLLSAVFIFQAQSLEPRSHYQWFLTNHMVLNIALVIVGLIIGYFVKNFIYILIGASALLSIYCLLFLFEAEGGLISQYFLAVFTIFMAVSVVANLFRYFVDWLLDKKFLVT
jgi:uncharacterized membrane protein YbjE (DUF340 family)